MHDNIKVYNRSRIHEVRLSKLEPKLDRKDNERFSKLVNTKGWFLGDMKILDKLDNIEVSVNGKRRTIAFVFNSLINMADSTRKGQYMDEDDYETLHCLSAAINMDDDKMVDGSAIINVYYEYKYIGQTLKDGFTNLFATNNDIRRHAVFTNIVAVEILYCKFDQIRCFAKFSKNRNNNFTTVLSDEIFVLNKKVNINKLKK